MIYFNFLFLIRIYRLRYDKLIKLVEELENMTSVGNSSLPLHDNPVVSDNYEYLRFQMKLACCVYMCWTLIILTRVYNFQLSHVRWRLSKLFVNYMTPLDIVNTKVSAIKDTITHCLFYFNIRHVQYVIRSIKQTLSTITNNILSNRPSTFNLGRLFTQIKNIFILIQTISKSVSGLITAFLLCMKQILNLPRKIIAAISHVKKKIAKFWQTIEQIIQIVHMPIALLSAIGGTILSITRFLNRLERPRFN